MQTVNLLTIELQLRVDESINYKKEPKNLIFSLTPSLKSSSDGLY